MSLILDALRKSEQDRRANDTLALGEMPMTPSEPPSRPRWLVGVAVALVVAAVAAALYLMIPWRRAEAPVAVAKAPVVVATPPPGEPVSVIGTAPPPESPPVLQTNAFAPAPATGGARDLAQEAQVAATQPKTAPAPAVTVAAVAPAAKPVVPTPPPIKFLRGMPPEFQKALPELVMNIHVYSTVEAERLLYINNTPYIAGQKIHDDLLVEQIVPDGAVLVFRGQRFKLPRPS
jgi:general secretion pathway protein B